MTNYELIATVLAGLALALSAISLFWQARLQRENNALQIATSELAKKQLALLESEAVEKTRAKLRLDLIKEGQGRYRFVLSNVGTADAKNVTLELLLDDPKKSPLIANEVSQKLPAPKLAAGSSLTLIAAIHMQSPLAYNVKLKWINTDGSAAEEDTYVSL